MGSHFGGSFVTTSNGQSTHVQEHIRVYILFK